MSESMKEKIIDKAVDGVLDFIADTSSEEIKEIVDKNKHQKILGKTILKFVDSDYFKNEYRQIVFEYNKGMIYNLDDEVLNPIKTKKQIAESIYSVVKSVFSSDDDNVYDKLANDIASLYLQRAKVTIQLYDIINLQHQAITQITDDISELREELRSKYRKELQFKYEKELLLKKELKNEVISTLNEINNNYLFMVLKKSAVLENVNEVGLEASIITKIEEVIDRIEEYVQDDFVNKDVVCNFANGVDKVEKKISYLEFSEIYFRNVVLAGTERFLKYDNIMDTESYVLILKLRNEVQSNLFQPLIVMGQTNILNCKNIKIDVEAFRKTLKEIGCLLVALYRKLGEHNITARVRGEKN